MTSLIAIRCTDGVVIGSDGAATFGPDASVRTIEQSYVRKVDIVGGHVILAGTGYVGHSQRFKSVVETMWANKEFSGKPGMEISKALCTGLRNDLASTSSPANLFSAFAAFPASDGPCLVELPGGVTQLQPEIKEVDGLWFASSGSGQQITDPFLALFRSLFWQDSAPNLQGGIFTALWALIHACAVNPGGIDEPITIAVLEAAKGKYSARTLSDDELEEHRNIVSASADHISEFKAILQGDKQAETPPKPPGPPDTA